ncbi:MAG: prepilin-type N-terminal cleavage/methylation domain-containing protein [Kiritimatiellae bacterium]|nr:prepilin-type N-terminal cleavage/methylation domain-containing protein [Kiritimatiellia bacterium]
MRIDWRTKRSVRGNRGGFTLVEVLVAAALIALILAGAVQAVVAVNRMNYHSGLRLAAHGLCRERLEELRAAPYADLQVGEVEDTVRMANLGGTQREPISATRTTIIESHSDGTPRVHVTVSLSWQHTGRDFSESASAVIYPPR